MAALVKKPHLLGLIGLVVLCSLQAHRVMASDSVPRPSLFVEQSTILPAITTKVLFFY